MIELVNVYKSFDGKDILQDVNLNIQEKDSYLILGKSGAGKTVLLKIIVGLLEPDRGKVIFEGKDRSTLNKIERVSMRLNFGVVFQLSALFDYLTVEENVGFYFMHHRKDLSPSEIKKKVKEALSLVGLKDIEDKYPYQLSGGMKKRVAIARAIVYNPKIIVYDEPTTGLDPVNVEKIVELIDYLHRRLDNTSIIVTHDLEVGLMLANRVAFLHEGRVIMEKDKREFLKISDSRIKQFISGNSFKYNGGEV